MTRRILVASLALLLPAQSPTGSLAEGSGSVAATAHGIRLTLSVPKRVYQQRALVAVTVSVENVSDQRIAVDYYIPPCGNVGEYGGAYGWSPVAVLTAAGKPIVAPVRAFRPGPDPRCGPYGVLLEPRQMVKQRFLVVLWAGRLRASVGTTTQGTGAGGLVTTPVLSVRLVHGIGPTAELHADAGSLYTTVRPRRPVRGPMFYLNWVSCGAQSSPQPGGTREILWRATTTRRVVAWCVPATEWHAAAGWLNQPIVSIDYVNFGAVYFQGPVSSGTYGGGATVSGDPSAFQLTKFVTYNWNVPGSVSYPGAAGAGSFNDNANGSVASC